MSLRIHLRKMKHKLGADNTVNYELRGMESKYASKLQDGVEPSETDYEVLEDLNQYLGKKIKIEFQDQINCIACGRKTNKSFNQGYCFPCLQKLAECDNCIIKPELCHFDQGTCRDNEFAADHCNIPHSLYISLTSGMKIGVTRQMQEQVRWVDQGAVQALRLTTLKRRYHAGLLEVELAKDMADKTNWRKMLKNEIDQVDLIEEKDLLLEKIQQLISSSKLSSELAYLIEDSSLLGNDKLPVQEIKYPVLEYPSKLNSFNLDKDPLVTGTLTGIKGQYLILDTGVINLRKYGGYLVDIDFN